MFIIIHPGAASQCLCLVFACRCSVCILQDHVGVSLKENMTIEEDLVLEEMDSDRDELQVEQEKRSDPQVEDECRPPMDVLARVVPHLSTSAQEDAQTQTERWTPLIENIRREARQAAMASMEER